MIDKSAIKKLKMQDSKNDFAYWQAQSYAQRLAALELIRNEYISWKYGAPQRFQRVYRIIKH